MSMNNDNAERRDYSLTNRIEGWARPAAKKYTPSLAKRQHILGDPDGRWSSIFTVTIKPATQQYPSPALNLQISNGNGSAFQRIGGLEDLEEFAGALLSWTIELKDIWVLAKKDGQLLEQASKDVQQRADMLREMMTTFQQEPEQPPIQEWEANN